MTPMTSRSMSEAAYGPELPISVEIEETEDGGCIIHYEWDEEHPVTCVLNSWTEDDFLNMLRRACDEVLGEDQ